MFRRRRNLWHRAQTEGDLASRLARKPELDSVCALNAMALNRHHPYREDDYRELINALRQRSLYRYAALYPRRPTRLARRARAFELPEGVLVLAREATAHLPELQDLAQRPLRLHCLALQWDHGRERIRLAVNARWARERRKAVLALVSSGYWRRNPGGRGYAPSPRQAIAAVNDITRELRELDRHVFVKPTTRLGYDRAVTGAVVRWLISEAGHTPQRAKARTKRYLLRWSRMQP